MSKVFLDRPPSPPSPSRPFLSIFVHLYTSKFKNWLLPLSLAADFETACIAQLIQVELLRRRLRLSQIQGNSSAKFQFLSSFVYTKNPMTSKMPSCGYEFYCYSFVVAPSRPASIRSSISSRHREAYQHSSFA